MKENDSEKFIFTLDARLGNLDAREDMWAEIAELGVYLHIISHLTHFFDKYRSSPNPT